MPNDKQWTRPAPGRRGQLRDIALASALAVLAVISAELVRSVRPDADLGWAGVEAYLWSVAIVLPLSMRRRFPITVMVVCAALFYVIGERELGLIASLTVQAAPFMAIYAAWAWTPYRQRVKLWTALVFTGMFVWLTVIVIEQAGEHASESPGVLPGPVALGLQTFMINVLYFFGAMAWGLAAWRSARQRAQLRSQAEKLAAEQAENARRAVADERVRIARDLHDVVAHHVSSIGVQAAGARRLIDRDTAASRDALQVIEASSRQAVQEMHQIVSLLRVDDPGGATTAAGDDRTPQPGLDALHDLVDRARADGLALSFRESGTPFDVPGTVALSLYRTAQEALVNVRKHASGSHAEVVLRYLGPDDGADPAVEVEVIDDGRGGNTTADSDHSGWGLVGISERAALHGGSSEIGPRPGGGYRVRVRIPADPATSTSIPDPTGTADPTNTADPTSTADTAGTTR